MIYLVKKQNNTLETFLSEDALLKNGFKLSDTYMVSNDDYNKAKGLAYIDSNGKIKLGEPPETIKLRRIRELKQYLAETDYVVLKIAEGVATADAYADILEQRQKYRQELNELL